MEQGKLKERKLIIINTNNLFTKIREINSPYFILFFLPFFFIACNSQSTSNFQELKKRYNSEILNYFYETTYYQDGMHRKIEYLSKWDRNINLHIAGNYSKSDISLIKEIVGKINTLEISIKVNITNISKNSNCIVFFGTREGFEKHSGYKVNDKALGIAITESRRGRIHKGYVGVFGDLPLKIKRNVIYEEVVQVLGVQGDSFSFRNSLFYEVKNPKNFYFDDIPDIDKKILEILYDSILPFGLKRNVFEKRFGDVLNISSNEDKIIKTLVEYNLTMKDLDFIELNCFDKGHFMRFSKDIPVFVKNNSEDSEEILKRMISKIRKQFEGAKIYYSDSPLISDGIFISFIKGGTNKKIETELKVYDGKAMYPKIWKSEIVFKYGENCTVENKINSLEKVFLKSLGFFHFDEDPTAFNYKNLNLIYDENIPDGLHINDFKKIKEKYRNLLNEKNTKI